MGVNYSKNKNKNETNPLIIARSPKIIVSPKIIECRRCCGRGYTVYYPYGLCIAEPCLVCGNRGIISQ